MANRCLLRVKWYQCHELSKKIDYDLQRALLGKNFVQPQKMWGTANFSGATLASREVSKKKAPEVRL